MDKPYTKRDAMSDLGDYYTIWKPEHAEKICVTLGVPYNPKLAYKHHSSSDPKGAHMNKDAEGTMGVDGFHLVEYVAAQFKLTVSAPFIGRGRVAQCYWDAIAKHLALPPEADTD